MAIQEEALHKLGPVIHPEVSVCVQGVSEVQDFVDDVCHSLHDRSIRLGSERRGLERESGECRQRDLSE